MVLIMINLRLAINIVYSGREIKFPNATDLS